MPFACFKNSPNRFAGFQTIKYNFGREVLLFSPLAKRFSLTGNQPERNFRGLRNVQSVRKPTNTTNTTNSANSANSANSVNTINTEKPTKPLNASNQANTTKQTTKKTKNEIQKIITPKSASRCYISGCAARIYNDVGNRAALL